MGPEMEDAGGQNRVGVPLFQDIGQVLQIARAAAGDDRHPLEAMKATFAAALQEISIRREMPIRIDYVSGYPSVRFDEVLLQRLRDAAAAAGLKHRDLPTPIGHDALHVGRVVPSAMLFIPCHGGLSHNPAESITQEWSAAGLATLAPAVIETAGGLA